MLEGGWTVAPYLVGGGEEALQIAPSDGTEVTGEATEDGAALAGVLEKVRGGIWRFGSALQELLVHAVLHEMRKT